MDSFSKLGDLQNQQKTLEDWYGSMSEQLQQEQLRLSLKFNEMKMKLLEQKKVYLQASQDCIDSLSLGSSTQIPASTKIKSPPSRIPQRISSSKTQRRHSTAKPVQTTVRRRTDREILQERYGISLHGSESEVESGSASMAESDNTDGSSAQDCIVERTRGISPVRPKVYIEKQRKIHRSMEHIDHKSSRRRSTKTDLKQRDAKGCDAEVTANISSSTPVRQELNVIYLKDKQTSARSLLVDMENAVRDPVCLLCETEKWCSKTIFHFRSSFWNAKIDLSPGNGTIACRFLFLFTWEHNRSMPQLFLHLFPFFPATTTPMHALWAKILSFCF